MSPTSPHHCARPLVCWISINKDVIPDMYRVTRKKYWVSSIPKQTYEGFHLFIIKRSRLESFLLRQLTFLWKIINLKRFQNLVSVSFQWSRDGEILLRAQINIFNTFSLLGFLQNNLILSNNLIYTRRHEKSYFRGKWLALNQIKLCAWKVFGAWRSLADMW